MFNSIVKRLSKKITDARAKEKSEKKKNLIAEIDEIYKLFLEGEGRLPEGFSYRYETWPGTPFSAYLRELQDGFYRLEDRSGISDWLYLDGSAEIKIAAAAICLWVKRNREMNSLVREKCHHFCDYRVKYPLRGMIMVVTDDMHGFDEIDEGSIQACKDLGISFCTVLSDRKLYDLIGQKEKEITYSTYLGAFDDDYLVWTLE